MQEWHEFQIRVYYEDTDAQGVVYFANYLKFMERGRTEWLRELGIEHDWLLREHGLCFALTGTAARFLRPARFNDQLLIRTGISRMGRASIEIEQEVYRLSDNEILCSADCVVACLDAQKFWPRRIPSGILDSLRSAFKKGQTQESR